ncbi:MAG TPA: hypothetical protein VGG35_24335 [Streptosporangiaceae bacterium]|jgi:hypothetical protein
MGADAAGTGTGTAAGQARDGHQDYSGTPLPRKLGIGEDDELAVIGAPDGFTDTLRELLAADLPEVAEGMHTDLADEARYDVIVTFVTERTELEAQLPRLRARMAPACGLWVAWPKRASGLPTDMSDDVVREIALPTGLVDNKVCAISPAWTGLRLVIRRELR